MRRHLLTDGSGQIVPSLPFGLSRVVQVAFALDSLAAKAGDQLLKRQIRSISALCPTRPSGFRSIMPKLDRLMKRRYKKLTYRRQKGKIDAYEALVFCKVYIGSKRPARLLVTCSRRIEFGSCSTFMVYPGSGWPVSQRSGRIRFLKMALSMGQFQLWFSQRPDSWISTPSNLGSTFS